MTDPMNARQEPATAAGQRAPQVAECGHDGTAVRWNPWNEAVQCHVCGTVYSVRREGAAARDAEVARPESIVWLADTDGRHVHAYRVHPTINATTAAPGKVAGVSLCGNGWRHGDSRVSEAYGACADCRDVLYALASLPEPVPAAGLDVERLDDLIRAGDMVVGVLGAVPAECNRVGLADPICTLHDAEWSTRNGVDLGHCEWIEARMVTVGEWSAARLAGPPAPSPITADKAPSWFRDAVEKLRQRDPQSEPDDYWTGWNDALDRVLTRLAGPAAATSQEERRG